MHGSEISIARKQRYIVGITAAIIALTRFVSLSKTPWDWDEVLFCLAVNDYNVAWHQPHPPGFPLYIALGKLVRIFADSDFHALQTVNVIAAMCAFPVMFWTARAFQMSFHGAMAAGILFAFLPNVWFYGGTAFSDLPAALLFLAAIGAYVGSGTNARRYLLGSVLLAAGVLFRPQNAVVAVFPWTIATIRLLRAKQWRALIAGTLATVIVVAVGFGAAMWVTGAEAYVGSLRAHSAYVKMADSVGSPSRPPLGEVLLTQLDPFEGGKASLVMALLALVAIVGGRRRTVAEVLLTFVPFFIFALFTVNPLGASRFSLNYIAGIVLLAVEGAAVLGRVAGRMHPRADLALRTAVIAAVAIRFATWTLPAFEVPRSTVSPPVAAAMWLRNNVPLSRTVFVDESIWPWARYYAPDHKQVRPRMPFNVIMNPESAQGWYIGNGVTDSDGAIRFIRPRTRIWNLVTKRSFESYVQPSSNVVMFGRGWYGPEGDMTDAWRWSSDRSLLLLGLAPGKGELRLKFSLPLDSLQKPVTVTLRYNGDVLDTIVAEEGEHDVRYVVPSRTTTPNMLNIEVSDSFVPAEHGSHDKRRLALMLRKVSWKKL